MQLYVTWLKQRYFENINLELVTLINLRLNYPVLCRWPFNAKKAVLLGKETRQEE